MSRNWVWAIVLGAGLMVGNAMHLPSAGNAQAEAGYEIVKPATLSPGTAVPEPTKEVVLTVSGNINGDKPVAFDLPMLEQLGVIRYTTPTSWTNGPSTFDGVLLSDLLDVLGASKAKSLVLTALNDYQTSMPVEEAYRWPVMLAFKENGQYMSRRSRGPIWVVYPQHLDPQLGNREYLSRWVWQLARIDVQ